MTCNPLIPFTKTLCGANKAGVQQHKVFIIRHQDLLPLYEDSVYDLDDQGVINLLKPKYRRHFTKIESTRKAISFVETQTFSDSGVETIENTFQLGINSFSAENKNFTASLSGEPVVIIFKLNMGQWVGVGLDGEFELESSVLTVDETTNNRVLTFKSEVPNMIFEIDAAIIADLITAPVIETIDGFNYLLDFSFIN